MGGVIGTVIQPNMIRLMEDVRQGTLDFVLTKPEDAQVLVSVREVRIWQAVDVVVGVVVLAVAVARLQVGDSASRRLGLRARARPRRGDDLLLLACPRDGRFWLVRMDQIVELFEGSTSPAAGRSRSTRAGCATR